jgi:two-component system sensor kinase FixL
VVEKGQLTGIQGIIRDVTERKAAEERLRRMRTQLTHVARLSTMGEMVAGIAHEVNQPLYSILNFAKATRNVLLSESGFNLNELCEWSEEMVSASARAGTIMARLRDFARRSPSRRVPASINEIAEESIQLMGFEARRRQVAIRREFTEADPVIEVDRVQIQQVLVNLLRNACEAAEESAAPEARVSVRTAAAGESAKVSVADNGPGLPGQEGLNIFDAFVTTKANGLGMGLAISRSIVEAHGGSLWADADRDGGATFHFTLPLARGGQGNGE